MNLKRGSKFTSCDVLNLPDQPLTYVNRFAYLGLLISYKKAHISLTVLQEDAESPWQLHPRYLAYLNLRQPHSKGYQASEPSRGHKSSGTTPDNPYQICLSSGGDATNL